MGVLFGRERRQWTAEPPIPPYPGANIYGQPSVNTQPDRALIVPTVWGCVQLLANAVAMLPLMTYRRTADVPARITDPPLVQTPAADMTQSEWLHELMVSLLLRGNAYGMKTSLNGLGYPQQVVLLNPDRVQPQVDEDTGDVRYFVGPSRVDMTDRIWHVRGMTLPGKKLGLSPIEYAAEAIGVDLASRKFASDFFSGGGIPKAVLESDMDITQEQARTLKDRLMAATRNREPVALGSGVKYNQISVKPNESQFLETQAANISEIARIFGVPAELVGGKVGSSMTYANVEQRSVDFLTFSLSMWLRRIEDAFFTLLPQPQYVQFNTASLLRTDAETQAKVDAIRVASKVMPPSRLLRRMDEPPLTDAEKTELELVPMTVTPMGLPKALPKPPTPETSPDTPDVGPKPKLGVVNG
ncbi:MAG TPA: phage portal protein [Mycobacterium sp.]|nr:phage portal protein [Mycobacterium sp.]